MDLAQALKRAAPFAAAGKGLAADDPRQGIHVVPATFHVNLPVVMLDDVPLPHYPAHVIAQDGDVGIVIHLDPHVRVPHVVIDADQTEKALKQLRKQDFRLDCTAAGLATFTSAAGQQLNVAAYRPESYPALPGMPSAYRPVRADAMTVLRRVLHAAAKDDQDRPDLARVHLTREWAEATDQQRIARSYVGLVAGASCLVAPELFRDWPKRDPETGVSVGEEVGWLWLQVGEELRFASMHPDGDYYRLDNLMPEKDHGYWHDFMVAALLPAAESARDTSEADLVELAFSSGSLEVRGVRQDGTVTSSSVMPASGATTPVRLVLRGRMLKDALRAFGGTLRLFWTGPQQPIRLEDAHTTELIWPLVLDQVEAEHGEARH
jgi:hypothetical protein